MLSWLCCSIEPVADIRFKSICSLGVMNFPRKVAKKKSKEEKVTAIL